MKQKEEVGEPTPPRSLLELARSLPEPLLAHALTHSSWVPHRVDSYERLEFLGDSVLGLVMASHLYDHFPDYEEGRLAKLKAYVVSRRSCSEVARRIGLRDLVLEAAPGGQEQRRELAASATALGNIMEAIIGAVYLAHGFRSTREAVIAAFTQQLSYGLAHYVDFKSTLQEYAATLEKAIEYCLVLTEGPPHERVFTSEVWVGGEMRGHGVGRSIRASEQRAARAALISLGLLNEAVSLGEECDI